MSRLDTALSVVRTVFTARLAPVLLLVFVVVWPLAGFPWWPLVLVLGLAVVLRVLGFGYLLAGKRGPVLLVALLLVTTLGAWSPWLAVTALGAGIAVAGAFRLPRWQLLAVGMVLFLCAGAGWVTETVIAAQQRAASYEQTREHNRAQILPRSPRQVLGAVMETVADGDTSSACSLFTAPAEVQLAAAFDAPDCAAAVLAWHERVTRPEDYGLSPRLLGDVSTVSPDRETATVAGCGLRWFSPVDGAEPPAGPASPGRMQLRRVLGLGYEITDYRPC
ncbi:hypothetical protein ACU61A_41195 [Pseudonocardia sichuanensis]